MLMGILLAAAVWAVLWILAWFFLWRKKSQRWPLWVAFTPTVPVAFSAVLGLVWAVWGMQPLAGVFATVVLAIGLGKLIVAGAGRRNVFARSRMKAGQPQTAPHGLVEGESCDSGI